MPEEKQVNNALSEMFAKTMNLTKSLSTKINRDFLSVLTDYIAPSSLAKTSTSEQWLVNFTIHNQYMTIFTRQTCSDETGMET